MTNPHNQTFPNSKPSAETSKGGVFESAPIYSNVKSGLRKAWVITMVSNVVLWLTAVIIWSVWLGKVEADNGVMYWVRLLALLVVGLMPAVGFVILMLAIRRTLQWRRFGSTPLYLDPIQGFVGGGVAGLVCLPSSVSVNSRYDVSLVCIYTYETRGPNNEHTSAERMVWQDSQVGKLNQGTDGVNLSFRFNVPSEVPPSENLSGNYHHWRLHLHAAIEGGDLSRSFDIQVLPSAQQPPQSTQQLSMKSVQHFIAGHSKAHLDQLMELMQVKIARGTLTLSYPYGRQKWMGLLFFLLGAGLVMTGFFVLGLFVPGQGNQLPSTFFGLMLLLMSLLILFWGVCIPSNRLDVRIGEGSIIVLRNIWGVRVYQKKLAISQLQATVVEKKYCGLSGVFLRPRYNVMAIGLDGQKIVLAEDLTNKSTAERALAFLRENGRLNV